MRPWWGNHVGNLNQWSCNYHSSYHRGQQLQYSDHYFIQSITECGEPVWNEQMMCSQDWGPGSIALTGIFICSFMQAQSSKQEKSKNKDKKISLLTWAYGTVLCVHLFICSSLVPAWSESWCFKSSCKFKHVQKKKESVGFKKKTTNLSCLVVLSDVEMEQVSKPEVTQPCWQCCHFCSQGSV